MNSPKSDRKLDKRYERAGKNWTPEEVNILGDKYGLISDKALSRRLQRSPNSLHIASVRKLHHGRKANFYTARELSNILGISCSKTLVSWVEARWIKARRSTVHAGQYRAWKFLDQHIIKFLRERPWLLNLKKMEQHYFRTIVQEEYDKDPWYTCIETAPMLGVKSDDPIQRYIFRGWLKAEKKPGGPAAGVWIIRRSAIEHFLANDPRPQHRYEASSNAIKKTWRRRGNPLRLSTIWSVLCPNCNTTAVVKAPPHLHGPAVQQLFMNIYTNGTCSHGLVCTLEEIKA